MEAEMCANEKRGRDKVMSNRVELRRRDAIGWEVTQREWARKGRGEKKRNEWKKQRDWLVGRGRRRRKDACNQSWAKSCCSRYKIQERSWRKSDRHTSTQPWVDVDMCGMSFYPEERGSASVASEWATLESATKKPVGWQQRCTHWATKGQAWLGFLFILL